MSTSAVILIIKFRQPVTVAVAPSAEIVPIVAVNVAKTSTLIGVTEG